MASEGIDKRKVTLFLILVVIALACVVFLLDTLFFAQPHTDPNIQKQPHHSLLDSGPQPSHPAVARFETRA